jgi:hypothetical protein
VEHPASARRTSVHQVVHIIKKKKNAPVDFSFLLKCANNLAPLHSNPLLDSVMLQSEMNYIVSHPLRLSALLLLVLPQALLAHAGHHHETGLPEFAAHILLGLQYLAALLIPAAAVFFFLRYKKSLKSHPQKKSK